MTEAITKDALTDASSGPEQVSQGRVNKVFHDRYRELLEGVPAGQPTWVTTGGAEGGVYGTLEGLSAEQASSGVGGTTLAAHAEHLRWAIQLGNDYFAGIEPTSDWSESWRVTKVDAAAWDDLRNELRQAGAKLLDNILEEQRWDDDMAINGALASYGHTAYHLGALRQLKKRVEGETQHVE